jgi:hypothetical protein
VEQTNDSLKHGYRNAITHKVDDQYAEVVIATSIPVALAIPLAPPVIVPLLLLAVVEIIIAITLYT